MKKTIIAVIALLFVFNICFCRCSLADESSEKAAVSASQEWLSLLDNKKYGESWDEAAAIFKAAVTKSDWERQINAIYTPFGKLRARILLSSTYAETLPGAPDGKYVVIQYKSSFENKKSAIETITPIYQVTGNVKR